MMETSVALAVSALMILLTFGLITFVGNQRFRSSMNSAQSFIQQQYNEVNSGINDRMDKAESVMTDLGCSGSDTIAANSNNCFIIGRLLTFHKTEIMSSYVIAKRSADPGDWPDMDKTPVENLSDASKISLYAVTGNSVYYGTDSGADTGLRPTVKPVGNGSEIKAMWTIRGEANSVSRMNVGESLLIARSPADGTLVVLTNLGDLQETNRDYVQLAINAGSVFNMASSANKLVLGITNGSMGFYGGLMCLAGGNGSAGITSNFNAGAITRTKDGRTQTWGVDWNNLDSNSAAILNACQNWEDWNADKS